MIIGFKLLVFWIVYIVQLIMAEKYHGWWELGVPKKSTHSTVSYNYYEELTFTWNLLCFKRLLIKWANENHYKQNPIQSWVLIANFLLFHDGNWALQNERLIAFISIFKKFFISQQIAAAFQTKVLFIWESLNRECCQYLLRDEEVEHRRSRRFHNVRDSLQYILM